MWVAGERHQRRGESLKIHKSADPEAEKGGERPSWERAAEKAAAS